MRLKKPRMSVQEPKISHRLKMSLLQLSLLLEVFRMPLGESKMRVGLEGYN